MDDSILRWIALGLLIVLPPLGAVFLHWARCPGWAVVGGVAVGFLLGPDLFGRVSPALYERMMIGGVEEGQARDRLRSEHGADLLAAEYSRWNQLQLEELRKEQAREREQREQALSDARTQHQAPLRGLVLVTVAIILLGAGPLGERSGHSHHGWITPLSVGLGSAILPGALAYFTMRWWWTESEAEALLIAAAVGIGPWALTPGDREAADRAEFSGAHMIQTAGCIASIVAIVLAGFVMWTQQSWSGLMWTAPLLALPAGWIMPPPTNLRVLTSLGRVLEFVFIPILAACVSVKIELLQHFSFWPIVVILVLSDDGRWLGAFLGAMVLGGRTGLRTMRLVLGSMAAGPTQLAVTAMAVHAAMITEDVILPLVLGAVLIEMTAPARRSMARRIAQTEEEIESMRDSDD